MTSKYAERDKPLNGVGVEISKRQVVRLLTSNLETFAEEDQRVLRAGLTSAPFITVDDTSARHARCDGVTTHIGGERFTTFRTGRSKSRQAFLSLLRAGHQDYVTIASEGALWGAVRYHDLLGKAVIVSDDAGQFRVGIHALCWVHAERLVHTLVPTTRAQAQALEAARQLIWWFYRDLKA